MAKCHDLKKGQVYGCEHCKLEMKVIRECECDDTAEACACLTQAGSCVFKCCDEEMKKIA